MKMNRDVTIAINLVSKLTQSPQRALDLARQLGTTEGYLHQIVNKLNKNGVVAVARGPGGGVFRPKGYNSINLYAVYEALGQAPARTWSANDESARVANSFRQYLMGYQLPYGVSA